ncbi:MAG: class I SAM-dependent methyltransferase [Planctomycetota bacterium]|nr:MAG: class I SAM-dependent methyltransferase [Planctomycetota bacterium]
MCSRSGRSVLELGAGSAYHTILMLGQGAERIVATEISPELLETTRRNVASNCPEARNVEYRVANWLDTEGEFDVVVCNPPFCKSGQRIPTLFHRLPHPRLAQAPAAERPYRVRAVIDGRHREDSPPPEGERVCA